MTRNQGSAIRHAVILALVTLTSVAAARAEFGTEKDAKAMLERAVAALKQNKQRALEMFNEGEGGFKDRDLYVFCANASDGVVTASPYSKSENMRDIVGKKGYPVGKEIMDNASE